MAESKNEVSGLSSNRLKDYKQPAKEPQEVKSTRKLIEGINLRRNQREKKFAKRRTLGGDKDSQSLDVDTDNFPENNDNLNVKQKVPPSSHHGPFPVQPQSLLQGPPEGPPAVDQGSFTVPFPPLSLHGPFAVQPPSLFQGQMQEPFAVDQRLSPLPFQGVLLGSSAADQGLLRLQPPLLLQRPLQGLSAGDQGLLPAFHTSLPPGPHQGGSPLIFQAPGLLHPMPVQHQGLLGEDEEVEDTEQEQCLDDTDESKYGDVDDYASKEDKCLRQEMKQKAKLLHSEKECEVVEGVEYFKKYLEKDPRQSYLEDITVIPQLVQLLSCSKDCKLHVSVLYVLMRITTGYCDRLEDIIEAGGVPVLIEFVTPENLEVAENALKVLVNIVGEVPEARDSVLKHGMIPALMKFGEELNQLSKDFLESIICMIVQFFCPKLHCDAQEVLPLIGLLKEIVTVSTESGKKEVVHHVCYALANISASDGGNPLIQAVVDSGICQILIHHIDGNEVSAVRAMKTFYNIASNSDAYIQMVIDCELFGPILDFLAKCHFNTAREECIWCVCNLLSKGNPDQRRYAVSQGCIAALCAHINDRLMFGSASIIAILKVLQSLITDSYEPHAEYYMSLVEECGGLNEIRKYKDDPWLRIADSELCCSIIDLFTRKKEQQNK